MKKLLNVAVCDDETNAIDIISASVKKIFASRGIETATDVFKNAAELWQTLQNQAYNLVLLDINMPGMDGIELGKKIATLKGSPDIVFVSSNSDRVFDTFAVNPFGFVRKSNFVGDLASVVDRYAAQKMTEDSLLLRFELKDHGGLVTLNVALLKYVECLRNEQIFFMDGQDDRAIRSRMQQLEEQLSPCGFIRIHKGYLVNCRYIKRFDNGSVTLVTGETLPVGRSKHAEAMNAYLDFVHKNGISIIG